MQLGEIQTYLRKQNLDGWLMADFHGRNDIAVGMLGIDSMLTRRAFYFIPAVCPPVALVNPIEAGKFSHLPGETIVYDGYRGLEAELVKLLCDCRRVAMEYSPMGRLPYVGLVDAGTIELVRNLGVEVVSSADLVATFQARLTADQIVSHHTAAQHLIEIKDAAFGLIADKVQNGQQLVEYDVCNFIREQFRERGMTTMFGPNCSVGKNAGDPHYEPSEDNSATIEKGQLVLIDLWARLDAERSVYADITWMAFAGDRSDIPESYAKRFQVLVDARDAAIDFLRENIGKRVVYGYQVDDACRDVVVSAGYGQYFTHRTGHSIGNDVHGPGPNLDNLETEDRRELQSGHLFSIEPGIYMSDCGFRTEIDCLIGPDGPEVTTLPLQTEIIPLF